MSVLDPEHKFVFWCEKGPEGRLHIIWGNQIFIFRFRLFNKNSDQLGLKWDVHNCFNIRVDNLIFYLRGHKFLMSRKEKVEHVNKWGLTCNNSSDMLLSPWPQIMGISCNLNPNFKIRPSHPFNTDPHGATLSYLSTEFNIQIQIQIHRENPNRMKNYICHQDPVWDLFSWYEY